MTLTGPDILVVLQHLTQVQNQLFRVISIYTLKLVTQDNPERRQCKCDILSHITVCTTSLHDDKTHSKLMYFVIQLPLFITFYNMSNLTAHIYSLYECHIAVQITNLEQAHHNFRFTIETHNVVPEACLSFWYHIHGTSTGTLAVRQGHGALSHLLWREGFYDFEHWQYVWIKVDLSHGTKVSMVSR